VNLLVSLFTSNTRYGSVAEFPFQQLGFVALVILFLMAATSHDFWQHKLTPGVWKRLHMAVYVAYALLIAHVSLGALQSETSPWLALALGGGMAVLIALHLAAAVRELRRDRMKATLATDGFSDACDFASIPESRARVVTLGGERVAIFKHEGQPRALSNVCRHQNGPLGEGKIVGGCVTCPWHGYQYFPDTGTSPPPFDDRVAVFATKLVDGRVWVKV
jgi:methionine sulfoxide reductase heme-binding subunit